MNHLSLPQYDEGPSHKKPALANSAYNKITKANDAFKYGKRLRDDNDEGTENGEHEHGYVVREPVRKKTKKATVRRGGSMLERLSH